MLFSHACYEFKTLIFQHSKTAFFRLLENDPFLTGWLSVEHPLSFLPSRFLLRRPPTAPRRFATSGHVWPFRGPPQAGRKNHVGDVEKTRPWMAAPFCSDIWSGNNTCHLTSESPTAIAALRRGLIHKPTLVGGLPALAAKRPTLIFWRRWARAIFGGAACGSGRISPAWAGGRGGVRGGFLPLGNGGPSPIGSAGFEGGIFGLGGRLRRGF